jgi:hypothetical protein
VGLVRVLVGSIQSIYHGDTELQGVGEQMQRSAEECRGVQRSAEECRGVQIRRCRSISQYEY